MRGRFARIHQTGEIRRCMAPPVYRKFINKIRYINLHPSDLGLKQDDRACSATAKKKAGASAPAFSQNVVKLKETF
jgi:hypothetical protein